MFKDTLGEHVKWYTWDEGLVKQLEEDKENLAEKLLKVTYENEMLRGQVEKDRNLIHSLYKEIWELKNNKIVPSPKDTTNAIDEFSYEEMSEDLETMRKQNAELKKELDELKFKSSNRIHILEDKLETSEDEKRILKHNVKLAFVEFGNRFGLFDGE